MIELKNVSKYYTNNGVVTLGLRNINLKLNQGEIVAITGDSGSGKSTLLNVITAVDTYEEGEIYFEGNETSYFNQNDMDTFRKNYVSFIFQNYNIIDSYTVLENVMLPLLLAGKNHEEARKEAKEIIDKVGLSKRIKHKGTKLSGGEKQRCVIARALASDSMILACDEPTGNLDSQTGEEIIRLIQEVAKDKLVLIVTHNYNQVSSIATRRIKIADGEVVEDIHLQEQQEVEENNTMSLEERKVKKSTYLKLALQNVLSTPKKTIFSITVFMVISFITLILFLMMLERSYETYSDANHNYNLQAEDRMIVYRMDHQALDEEILNKVKYDEIYYNAFYEETKLTIACDPQGNYPISLDVCFSEHKIKNKLIQGTMPQNENEYYLVIPEQYKNGYYFDFLSILQKNIGIKKYHKYEYEIIGKITGIGWSKDVEYSYLISYGKISSDVKQLVIQSMQKNSYCVLEDGPSLEMSFVASNRNAIVLPKKYEGKEVEVHHYLNSIYEYTLDFDFEYNEEYVRPYLFYDEENPILPELNSVYEAVLYTKNVKEAKAFLEKQGYNVSVPIDQKVKASVINLAILYLFLALAIMALVCLYFISYVILSRVYASKNKDYGVLRSLGMVKKQLGRIVILEVLATGFIASILSFIVFVIVYNTTTDIFTMGDFMNFGIVLLYFVIMLIFSYFIAKRFNRRLYKFSVNTTMKGEVARND